MKTILPLFIAILFFACDKNQTTQKTNVAGAHNITKQATPAIGKGSPVLKDDQLHAIYEHYALLTTALVNGKATDARIAANAIEAGALLMEGGQHIAAAAARITASGDLDEQRIAYETISNEMIDRARQGGMTHGEVYVEYCPMVFNDQGAHWLSSDPAIRNPYFGDQMLTCGEVKETIQ